MLLFDSKERHPLFDFSPYNFWKVALVSLGKSHPLSLLMGKKSAKPYKEKMPA